MLLGLHDEAAALSQQKPKCYEIWPENETSFLVFSALATQWRIVCGMGFVNYEGIDYTSAKSTLELMGVQRRKWPELFADLRLMEQAVKNIFNEKNSQ